MIKNFKDWGLNESFRRHSVWGISGYKIKVYEDDGSIEFNQNHANMGQVKWFTIDKNSNFHTETRATEEFVTQKMIEILEPSLPNNQSKYKEENKRLFIQFIDNHPSFKKWFERAKRNVKFGL